MFAVADKSVVAAAFLAPVSVMVPLALVASYSPAVSSTILLLLIALAILSPIFAASSPFSTVTEYDLPAILIVTSDLPSVGAVIPVKSIVNVGLAVALPVVPAATAVSATVAAVASSPFKRYVSLNLVVVDTLSISLMSWLTSSWI